MFALHGGKKKPCAKGSRRNPKTGRCNKSKSSKKVKSAKSTKISKSDKSTCDANPC